MASKQSRKTNGRRPRARTAARRLRLEPLETRSLLSADLMWVMPWSQPTTARPEEPPTMYVRQSEIAHAHAEPVIDRETATAPAQAPLRDAAFASPSAWEAPRVAQDCAAATQHAAATTPAVTPVAPLPLTRMETKSIQTPAGQDNTTSTGIVSPATSFVAPVVVSPGLLQRAPGAFHTLASVQIKSATEEDPAQTSPTPLMLLTSLESSPRSVPAIDIHTAEQVRMTMFSAAHLNTAPPTPGERFAAVETAGPAGTGVSAAASAAEATRSGPAFKEEAKTASFMPVNAGSFESKSTAAALPIANPPVSLPNNDSIVALSRSNPSVASPATEGGFVDLQTPASLEAARAATGDSPRATYVEAEATPLTADSQTARFLAQDSQDGNVPGQSANVAVSKRGTELGKTAGYAQQVEGGMIELAAAPISAAGHALPADDVQGRAVALVSAEYGNSLSFVHEVCMDRALGLFHAFELAGGPLPTVHGVPTLAAKPVAARPQPTAVSSTAVSVESPVVRAGLLPVAAIALAVAAFDRIHRDNGEGPLEPGAAVLREPSKSRRWLGNRDA